MPLQQKTTHQKKSVSKKKEEKPLFLVPITPYNPNMAKQKIYKIINSSKPDEVFEEKFRLGRLQLALPEVARLRLVTQNNIFHKHEPTVWHHIKYMLKMTRKYEGMFDKKDLRILRLAILLHDIGKTPDIKKTDKIGREWFPGHVEKSYEMAKDILERLRYNKDTREKVLWLVKNHMIFNKYSKMSDEQKARLFNHPLFPLLFAHFLPDGLIILNKEKTVKQILQDYPRLAKKPDIRVLKMPYLFKKNL